MEELIGPKHWWRKWWGLLFIGVALIILVFFGYVAFLIWQGDITTPTNFSNKASVNAEKLIGEGNPTLGSIDAPITIVEFADFECPYCRESYFVIRSLLQDQEFANKIYFVYRHFPVATLHDHAIAAAEASMCANEQNKFWGYHDRLFQNQESLDIESLRRYALQSGLDITVFDKCVNERKYRSLVERDMADGLALGVQGTPTWFINGQKNVGAIPEDVFRKEITRLLEKQ